MSDITVCSGVIPLSMSCYVTPPQPPPTPNDSLNDIQNTLNTRGDLIVGGKSYFNGDVVFRSCKQIEYLQSELETVKNELNLMKSMLNDVYYAPGMPGYIAAKETFEHQVKRMRHQ